MVKTRAGAQDGDVAEVCVDNGIAITPDWKKLCKTVVSLMIDHLPNREPIMRKDALTTRLLLITVGVIATYAAITHFGIRLTPLV
jgi:hypothetical protein